MSEDIDYWSKLEELGPNDYFVFLLETKLEIGQFSDELLKPFVNLIYLPWTHDNRLSTPVERAEWIDYQYKELLLNIIYSSAILVHFRKQTDIQTYVELFMLASGFEPSFRNEKPLKDFDYRTFQIERFNNLSWFLHICIVDTGILRMLPNEYNPAYAWLYKFIVNADLWRIGAFTEVEGVSLRTFFEILRKYNQLFIEYLSGMDIASKPYLHLGKLEPEEAIIAIKKYFVKKLNVDVDRYIATGHI